MTRRRFSWRWSPSIEPRRLGYRKLASSPLCSALPSVRVMCALRHAHMGTHTAPVTGPQCPTCCRVSFGRRLSCSSPRRAPTTPSRWRCSSNRHHATTDTHYPNRAGQVLIVHRVSDSDGSDVRCSSTGPPSSATPSARAERRAAHTRTRAHTPPRRIRCDQCARDVPGAASRRGGAVVCARQHDRLADRNLAGSCHSLTSSSHPRDMRTSLFTPPVHSQAISTSKSGGAKPRAAGGGANLGRVGGGVKDARGRGGAPQKGDPRRSL
jgi:hypothetical protein